MPVLRVELRLSKEKRSLAFRDWIVLYKEAVRDFVGSVVALMALRERGALEYIGTEHFRSRLVLSVLSGREVVFREIRPLDAEFGTGLRDYEVSFLRLVDKMTNGTKLRINETGTGVKFAPGVCYGGEIEHECPTSRPIGYFLEGILALAIFAKNPVTIVFRGVTNSDSDLSVDSIQSVTIPLLRKVAGVAGNLKLVKRGAEPAGGGEAVFTCSTATSIPPLDLTDPGLVKRIRGVAYSTRVAPSFSNRMVDAARGLLNRFTADVFIYTDHHSKQSGGDSPGCGLSLVAETTSHCLLVTDASSSTDSRNPEEIAIRAVKRLLEEIDYGGCVDTTHQSLALLLISLSREDVSRIRVGRLSPYTVHFLRDMKSFLGVVFKVAPDREGNTVLMTCVGIGYSNIAKRIN